MLHIGENIALGGQTNFLHFQTMELWIGYILPVLDIGIQ